MVEFPSGLGPVTSMHLLADRGSWKNLSHPSSVGTEEEESGADFLIVRPSAK